MENIIPQNNRTPQKRPHTAKKSEASEKLLNIDSRRESQESASKRPKHDFGYAYPKPESSKFEHAGGHKGFKNSSQGKIHT